MKDLPPQLEVNRIVESASLLLLDIILVINRRLHSDPTVTLTLAARVSPHVVNTCAENVIDFDELVVSAGRKTGARTLAVELIIEVSFYSISCVVLVCI